MTYTEDDLIECMEDVTKHEFMVMRHLAENGPKYKTKMMQDIIREFPNDMEHGEYLIPGKEYSDDLDQAILSLTNDGTIGYVGGPQYIGGKLALTDYGRDLYDTIMAHPEVEIDEDLAEFIERINPCQLGLWEDERMTECNEGFFFCSWCGGREFTSYAQTAPKDRTRPWQYEYVCTSCGSTMRMLYREAVE